MIFETETQNRLNWYAIRAVPRHEKRVRDRLEAHEIECFLPLTRAVHRWANGTRREVGIPLFPTYLFVRSTLHNRLVILGTQGVRCFVGTAGAPSSIPDHEIESLRCGLGATKCEGHPMLAEGEAVRIVRGLFCGLTGIVLRNSRTFRVVVTISVIMQGVCVELNANDVERLPQSTVHCGSAALRKTA